MTDFAQVVGDLWERYLKLLEDGVAEGYSPRLSSI